MLYLVRHAKAGSRHEFSGNDRLRPLSGTGRHQAKALVKRLVAEDVKRLISSPHLRCIQTLHPTAKAIGIKVETDERLAEGRSFVDLLDMLETLPDATVLCSHGDLIPDTMAALERRGCEFTTPIEWRKGSVWVLHRDGQGEIVKAEAWPPPDV